MTLNTKHTQKAAAKGICRCSAVFNLREKSITNTCDSADKTGKGGVGWGMGGWVQSNTPSSHQGQKIAVLANVKRLQFTNVSCQPTIVDNTFNILMLSLT